MTKVNIKELVSFYDEQHDAQAHSSAIKGFAGEELGIALLKHYFENEGESTAELLTEPDTERRRPCTTGKRKGYQLDGWLKVTSKLIPKKVVLYQVEIKSWSFHGIGSANRRLMFNCEGKALLDKKQKFLEHYWKSKTFREDKVKKVLALMEHPEDELYDEVLPLLCLWEAVHPPRNEDSGAWFHVDVDKNQTFKKNNVQPAGFDKVYIFSMSAYLRNLYVNKKCFIELDLPNTLARVTWLSKILPGVAYSPETRYLKSLFDQAEQTQDTPSLQNAP